VWCNTVERTHADKLPGTQQLAVSGSPLLEAVEIEVPVRINHSTALCREPPLRSVLTARPRVGDEQRKLPGTCHKTRSVDQAPRIELVHSFKRGRNFKRGRSFKRGRAVHHHRSRTVHLFGDSLFVVRREHGRAALLTLARAGTASDSLQRATAIQCPTSGLRLRAEPHTSAISLQSSGRFGAPACTTTTTTTLRAAARSQSEEWGWSVDALFNPCLCQACQHSTLLCITAQHALRTAVRLILECKAVRGCLPAPSMNQRSGP